MNDMVFIRKNLFRNKLRASLMIVSILFAFAIFGVLGSFERTFYAGEELAKADHLVIANKTNFILPLPISYYNRIATVEGVRQLTHISWFGGYYQDEKNVLAAVAVEPESYMKLYENDFIFPPRAQEAFIHQRTGVLVGERMAQYWGWKVGDHIPISNKSFSRKDGSHSWDFDIVGTFKGRAPQNGTNFMVLQYDYFNETRSFNKDMIGWLVLQTDSVAMNDRVIRTIDAMFANSPYETTTETEKAFSKAFTAQLGNIALIIGLVVGAAFVTILMIVGNTMVMAVRERTREIGVLKTLGFSNGRILRLVLSESVLLALIGGLLGLGIAALAIWSFLPLTRLQPEIILTAIMLILALGVFTGLAPALIAMRLKIADALGRS